MKILNIRLMGLVTVVVVLGLSCSESVVTDIDGNSYRAVKIGDQWWMAENLRVTRYRNGDAIPNITDNKAWSQLTTGALCNYDNDPEKAAIYGLLYTWYAVIDSRGIAPEGWHVPSDEEWKQLEISLGMSESEANKRA
ncbi:MAG: fibrobacter succinogenes major paralogous domain-containing protein [bacterium]